MAKAQIPIGEADFWWSRYGLGIALPIVLILWGLDSIISQNSYAIWGARGRISFVPVTGEQAVLMGVAWLGAALACFANYYAQYHEKMGWYYRWPMAIGALIAGGGVMWCNSFFLFA